MVVDAGGRRECECGCGQRLPRWRGTGSVPRFATDACRKRSHRDRQARQDAIAIWDALEIVDERRALSALAGLDASARAFLLTSLVEPLSVKRDTQRSRPNVGPWSVGA